MPAPPPKRAHTEPRRLTSAAYNPRTRIASAATEVAISAAGLIAKAVGGEGKAASSFHALAPAGALGRTHPYGMAPLGNALVAEVGSAMNHRRRAGLGRLAVLEDEILLEVRAGAESAESETDTRGEVPHGRKAIARFWTHKKGA